MAGFPPDGVYHFPMRRVEEIARLFMNEGGEVMETEAEQMERFYGSVEKMWPAMKRQMRDNADKGGWQDMKIRDLIDDADNRIATARWCIDGITGGCKKGPAGHIIDAVNYLVMAYERLTAEGTE